MKILWVVIFCGLLGATVAAPSSKISPPASKADVATEDNGSAEDNLCESKDSEADCNQTEYKEYMACVEEKKSIRKKRQAMCPQSDQPITTVDHNCQFEFNKCIVGCKGDSECESGCKKCSTVLSSPTQDCNADYNNCVSNCQTGQPCYTECQNLCPNSRPLGYKTVIFEGHNGNAPEKVQVPIGIGHNITTIIKLNNFINNTHTINIPTNVNNTNINTVHVYTNKTEGGRFGLGQTEKGSCCFAVQPKTCRSSTTGMRCHHHRHKTCGEQCTSRIIHVQSRSRCGRRGGCENGVAYVPEPSPRCHSMRQWPYVTCGGSNRQRNCNGCYDHYGYGFQNYYGSVPDRCLPCYDDGFDAGQMYRRGPVLGPSYYHQPPCYVTGTCQNYYGNCGYGCFGYQSMDPVWGYYPPPPPPPPQMPYYYPPQGPMSPEMWPENDYMDDIFPGDDDFSGSNPVNDKDWETVVQKCKVINADDNTVIIKNCTNADLDQNPYAAQPSQDDKGEGNIDGPYYQQPYPQSYAQPYGQQYAQAYNPYGYGPQFYPGPQYGPQIGVKPPRRNNNFDEETFSPDDFANDTNPDDFWDNNEEDIEKSLTDRGFEKENEIY